MSRSTNVVSAIIISMHSFFIANFFWIWPLVILDLILKGFALWRASKNNQLYWFIALFIVNSIGILPVIYLAFVDKQKLSKTLKRK